MNINLEERNRKILDAVIGKADQMCPGALALIGVYGSFATGDFYDKSDLDLLILINDERGWQLGCTFIQDDLGVGHDIYCTTWESLREDALYQHPNISKLMDSRIVYSTDEKYIGELESLRKMTKDILEAPFSGEDYEKAERSLKEAEHCYVQAISAESMSELWVYAGHVIYHIENAVAMLNKKYFRYGTKRVFQELEQMERRPRHLCELIQNVLEGESEEQIRQALTVLIRETTGVFKEVQASLPVKKASVTADSIRGTYEEMFSNWRNKMYAAAKMGDRHLSFMSMLSLNAMISEIAEGLDIAAHDVFQKYDPQNLLANAHTFDRILDEYLKEYKKTGLQEEKYPDIDSFVKKYLEVSANGIPEKVEK